MKSQIITIEPEDADKQVARQVSFYCLGHNADFLMGRHIA